VTLSGDSSENVFSDDDGLFTFSDLEAGDYTLTPSTDSGYTFEPESIEVTVTDADVADNDFAGTLVSAPSYLHFSFPDQYNFTENYPDAAASDEAEILFSDYTLTEGISYEVDDSGDVVTTVSGYALNQFVDEDIVRLQTPDPSDKLGSNDARNLYSVVSVANSDGFSNRFYFFKTGGTYVADLRWDQFITGYLLDIFYDGKTFFPDTLTGELSRKYNNKWSYDIYLFRKIDVKRPDADGTLATFEVGATTESYADDTEHLLGTTKFTVETVSYDDKDDVKAISMDQFITEYVLYDASPDAYNYEIVAVDDWSRGEWDYTAMQQAYFLPDYDRVVQIDATGDVVSQTQLDHPMRIDIIGTVIEGDESLYAKPAFAIYDDSENGAAE